MQDSKGSGEVGEQPASPAAHNPIDHIFQFHKALKRELHQIEVEAKHLQVCNPYVPASQASITSWLPTAVLLQRQARAAAAPLPLCFTLRSHDFARKHPDLLPRLDVECTWVRMPVVV